jgi:hypothetical protein
MRLLPLTLAVLALCACPAPSTTDGGTLGDPPTVAAVSPATGPSTGGTSVVLSGAHFVDGATVTFGGVAGTSVLVSSALRLTVTTPAATTAGTVAVTVTNPDGRAGPLADGFRYTSSTTLHITQALLSNPATQEDTSGQSMVSLKVTGAVEVPGVTPGAGPGAGVKAQVGWASQLSATPVSSDFTWVDATYQGDVDGAAAGDLARDSYQGLVTVAGPPGNGVATYSLAVRFSVDNGATWVLGDRDGSANGVTAAQLSTFTARRSGIDWCKLGGELTQPPPTVSLTTGATGPTIYGQVYVAGTTDLTGAGAGIEGQLGYGAPGTAPSTWTWAAGTYNHDTGQGANDEYQAPLPNPGPGSYHFAYRFRLNGGAWSYCDADGLATGGFTDDQAGTLTVSDPGVDRCVLQFPSTLETRAGRPSDLVYGRVFAAGVTDGTTPSTTVSTELGYGPASDLPTASSWAWGNTGAYNVKVSGGGEEYQARLTGPSVGTYAYAYRARLGAGAWSYCDLDGSDNGFQAAQAGTLTAKAFDVDDCSLVAATAVQTALPGQVTGAYQGRVHVTTLTDDAGVGPGVTAEVGYGAQGTQPSTWTTWTGGSYLADDGPGDVYAATMTAPTGLGSSDVAFRFKLGTNAWVYCDQDGSQNGYQRAQAGQLVVVAQSCRLEAVSAYTLNGGESLTITASALSAATGAAGAAPGLVVQVGVGPRDDDASTSSLWGWSAATFSGDSSGRDVFSARVWPAYSGNRAVAARASFDHGSTWTYCDLNGSDVNGYEVSQQYNVTIAGHRDLAFCNTQFPTSLGAAGGQVYGQLYDATLTPNANAAVIAQFGAGPKTADPGLAWAWVDAPFWSNPTAHPANNEYAVTWVPDAGGLSYAFRYSRDGGTWCYGDLDGNGTNGQGNSWDGFSGETAGSQPNLGAGPP